MAGAGPDDVISAAAGAPSGANGGLDTSPIESTMTAPQGRHGQRLDAELADHPDQVVEADLDVLQLGAGPPVSLGREVDDVARSRHQPRRPHMHPAELDVAALGGPGVLLEHVGVGALELQRNSLAHYSEGVDSVDERVDVGVEEVPVRLGDHAARFHVLEVPLGSDSHRQRCATPL
jgi:hypothetical protein